MRNIIYATVMLLFYSLFIWIVWNWVVPEVTGFERITYAQAFMLKVLVNMFSVSVEIEEEE